MTVNELICEYQNRFPDGHFFDKETLKFFGEKKSEMRVSRKLVTVTDYRGKKHSCYCLSTVQHNAPNGAITVKHYFDTETFREVFPDGN